LADIRACWYSFSCALVEVLEWCDIIEVEICVRGRIYPEREQYVSGCTRVGRGAVRPRFSQNRNVRKHRSFGSANIPIG
jgi:hypothetical protein